MAIVSSFGALRSMTPPPSWGTSSYATTLYGLRQSYAEIYRRQPNVRTCVDFLARNIAMLGLPTYRRVSDTDRERLNDHELGRWLNHPTPWTTRYRLIESLIADLGIYFNAYWLKVRDGRDIGLVRLPPEQMHVEGGLVPEQYVWTSGGRRKELALSEVVYFNGYNPLNPLMGLSPLETLRRILAEEAAAGEHRESYWRNASRHEGVIEQTADAPKWGRDQRREFREEWQEFSTGGARAGMTAVLPKGMHLVSNSFSAKESEYLSARKLSREECAAAYHIPLPFVGILDHATFSNITEQHKNLYQDTLAPWLEMIEQELIAQLLIECADQERVYVEFNIDAKMAGTPEERAQSLSLSIGKPWRTVNEGRALENLPRDDDPESDRIAAQQGGPAAFSSQPPSGTAALIAPTLHSTRARHMQRLRRLPVEERVAAFEGQLARFNRELEGDLRPLVMDTGEARRLAHIANADTLNRLQLEAINDW